jgi:hypothetical protein
MTSDAKTHQLTQEVYQYIDYIQKSFEEDEVTIRGNKPSSPTQNAQINIELEIAIEKVNDWKTSKPDLVSQICASMNRISNDLFDLAKSVTPVLVTLSLTGVLTVPAEPVALAVIAIAVARMGVASLCDE